MIINISFVGTGRMAEKMATVLLGMMKTPEYKMINLYSVFSRSENGGNCFKTKYGFDKMFTDWSQFLGDSGVSIVYIASPHSEHYRQTKALLESGKPCFVEKAFTVNSFQAEELIKLARKEKLFLAEAMWPRYQPLFHKLLLLIRDEVVGRPKILNASICYPVMHKERITDNYLGGGALLDLGVYALSFADAIFGGVSSLLLNDNFYGEIDESECLLIKHFGGEMSSLISSVGCMSNGVGSIYCEKGYINVDGINNVKKISVYNYNNSLVDEYFESESNNLGYEYEIKEVIESLLNGRIECPSMSHDETLRLMRLCDTIRAYMNLKYPNEVESC